MTHTTRTPAPVTRARTHHRLAETLQALGALALLLVFVVGIPALLLIAAPALDWAPVTLHGVISALTRPDDGHVLLAALTVTAWVAWFAFTLSVVLETVAVIRGLPTPRIPLLAATQRGAATLVATAAILLTTPTPGPTPAPASVPALTLAAAEHPAQAMTPAAPTIPRAHDSLAPASGPTIAHPRPADATGHAQQHASVTVRRGDTLWSIAAAHLGDGARFAEIARLNYGRPQPDGRTLTDSHWIYPGWTLLLPTPTHHAPPSKPADRTPTAAPHPKVDEYVVRRGDTLWGIAATHLGDPGRYREIYLLNRGHRQPDGGHLHDPQLIEPGWVLRLPPRTPTRHATAATAHPQPAPRSTRATPRPPVTPSSPSVPASVTGYPGAELVPTSQPTPPPLGPAPSDTGLVTAPDDQAHPGVDLGHLTLGLTALAATGLLAELTRRRRRQQARRLPGQRLSLPEGDLALTERTLRTARTPVTQHTVTSALIQMTATCRATHRDLPRLLAALISPTRLDLLVDDHGVPVAPFTSAPRTGTTTLWRLDLTQLTDEEPADTTCSSYPALVTLGTADDAIVLLNLEAAGALTIDADGDTAAALVRTLAVELATSPLSLGCSLILPPSLGDLAAVADPDRVCAVLPDAATRRAAVRAANVAAVLAELPVDDIHSARAQGVASDTWTPEIHITETTIQAARPWSGVVAISTATSEHDMWTLQGTRRGTALLRPLDLELDLAHLGDDHYAEILSLLRGSDDTTGDTSDVGPGGDVVESVDLRNPDDAPASLRAVALTSRRSAVLAALPGSTGADSATASEIVHPVTTGAPTGPRILLLGRVEIISAAGDGAAPRRGRSAELLAYLLLHPGASPREIDEALWPGERVSDDQRNSLVSRTRTWLGTDDDGQPYLHQVTTSRGYRLAPTVTSDWHDLLSLARTGLPGNGDNPADLLRALEFVRARPFLGVDPASYTWAESDMQDMISTIVDVAHEAAVRLTNARDFTAVQPVIARGLLADPANEQLHRDAICVAAQRGDTQEIQRIADRLRIQLQAIDPDATPDPTTARLLSHVLRGTAATRSPSRGGRAASESRQT